MTRSHIINKIRFSLCFSAIKKLSIRVQGDERNVTQEILSPISLDTRFNDDESLSNGFCLFLSLFNGISTFMGYLIPKLSLLNYSSGTLLLE